MCSEAHSAGVSTDRDEGADVMSKSAQGRPTWKLYLDFEMRKVDLHARCSYLADYRSGVDKAVQKLGLSESAALL